MAGTLPIRDLIARYAFARDSGDVEAFASMFCEEGVLRTKLWAVSGRSAIREALAKAATRAVRHHITTSLIEPTGPDAATGTTYFMAISNIGLDHAGRYSDSFVRRDGGWLFLERVVEIEWQAENSIWPPMTEGPFGPAASA